MAGGRPRKQRKVRGEWSDYPPLLTLEDCMELMQVSYTTLWRLLRSGEWEDLARMVRGRWRISKDRLRRWLDLEDERP